MFLQQEELVRRSQTCADVEVDNVRSKRYLSEVMATDLSRLNMAREDPDASLSCCPGLRLELTAGSCSNEAAATPCKDRKAFASCLDGLDAASPNVQVHPLFCSRLPFDPRAMRRLVSPTTPSSSSSSPGHAAALASSSPSTPAAHTTPSSSAFGSSSGASFLHKTRQLRGFEASAAGLPTSPSDTQLSSDLRRTAMLRAMLKRTDLSEGRQPSRPSLSLLGRSKRHPPSAMAAASPSHKEGCPPRLQDRRAGSCAAPEPCGRDGPAAAEACPDGAGGPAPCQETADQSSMETSSTGLSSSGRSSSNESLAAAE